MYAEGYKNIINIDFSEIVVEDMQLHYKNNNYDECFECTRRLRQTSWGTPAT